MTIKEIHDSIHEIHDKSADARTKVKGRRAAIAKLATVVERTRKKRIVPEGCLGWLSTTQSDAINSSDKYRVQFRGVEIGHLVPAASSSKNPSAIFHPKAEVLKKLNWPESEKSAGPWSWDEHAALITKFMQQCEAYTGFKKKNEREIQWQLAHVLTNDKTHVALEWMAALAWNGLFHEVGVSVNKDGVFGKKPGNIDLLVRRGRGFGSGYLVFEVKKPRNTDVQAALKQALRYATALDIEANTPDDEVNRANYRLVFGATGTKILNIGAVLVMEDSDKVRKVAPELLQQACRERGASKIDRLGLLLYTYDEKHDKATSWDWLPGWDATKPMNPKRSPTGE